MKSNSYFWVEVAVLTGMSALAYLPLVVKFGYFNDDWYLMYDVGTQGPQFFQHIFAIDRPGRALLMIPLYHLFGMNPLPYNLIAFLDFAYSLAPKKILYHNSCHPVYDLSGVSFTAQRD